MEALYGAPLSVTIELNFVCAMLEHIFLLPNPANSHTGSKNHFTISSEVCGTIKVTRGSIFSTAFENAGMRSKGPTWVCGI